LLRRALPGDLYSSWSFCVMLDFSQLLTGMQKGRHCKRQASLCVVVLSPTLPLPASKAAEKSSDARMESSVAL